MKQIFVWAQQPTSVAGISALFGTISAVLLHQMTWMQSVPLLSGSLISIALPDNTSAKADAVELAQDISAKLGSGNLAHEAGE